MASPGSKSIVLSAWGGVGDYCDVPGSCIEQRSDILIAAINLSLAQISGLVAADVCLEFDMGDS